MSARIHMCAQIEEDRLKPVSPNAAEHKEEDRLKSVLLKERITVAPSIESGGAVQKKEDGLKSVLPVRIALFALRFYKTYLSILFAGSCRFEPTCSQFMYQAIECYGVAGGVWLGTKRLLRCHPFSRKFGYDPVPENWNQPRSPELPTVGARYIVPSLSRGDHSGGVPSFEVTPSEAAASGVVGLCATAVPHEVRS